MKLVDILHDRYNHLTGLRTMAAHRYITIIGGLGAIIFMAQKLLGESTGSAGSERESIFASYQNVFSDSFIAIILLLLFLMGLYVLIYDAIARKVAGRVGDVLNKIVTTGVNICDAIDICERHLDNRKKLTFRQYYKPDEEFFYISKVIVVTAAMACFSLLFTLKAIWEDLEYYLSDVFSMYLKDCNNLHQELFAVILLVSFAVIYTALYMNWVKRFQIYKVSGWGGPSSDRNTGENYRSH